MLVELLAVTALQATLKPVSERELMGLLDGGVTLQRGEVVIIAGAAYYGPGGRFAEGDRAPRMGQWRAEDGRLCNWSWPDRRDERCVVVMTDEKGVFYSADNEAALAAGETYVIRFVPLPALQ